MILIVICEGIFLIVDYFTIYKSAGIKYTESLEFLLTTLEKREVSSSSLLIVNSSGIINRTETNSSLNEPLGYEEEY